MTAGPRPSRAPQKRPVTRGAARSTPSIWQQANDLFWKIVPFKVETIEKALTVLTIFVIAGSVLAAAIYAGIPQAVGTEMGQMAGRAGFKVKRVDVKGLNRMDSLTVYAVALDQQSIAMPLVDLEKVRGELLQYGWIGDARISRRWPDTLVVDILERKPAAVWQNNQRLVLIDGSGVILEMVDPRAIPDLPLVIGPNANQRVAGLFRLLNMSPTLKPNFAGATWVGNRRWDIRFESGEVLALPEGEDLAANALKNFARIESNQKLLGRGFVRFDMRDPTKFVVRLRRPVTDTPTPAPGAETVAPDGATPPAASAPAAATSSPAADQ